MLAVDLVTTWHYSLFAVLPHFGYTNSQQDKVGKSYLVVNLVNNCEQTAG